MEWRFFKFNLPGHWAIVAAALLPALPSYATDWRITPRLDLEESYTDNIYLAPPQSQKNDFISQISPGISLNETGPRFKVTADYQMQNIISARENARNFIDTIRNNESYSISDIKVSTFNHLYANASAELVKNHFFIESYATVRQQTVSAYGPQAVDNLYIQGNNTEVRTFSLSPYLRNRYSNFATSELRYNYSTVSADTAGFGSSQANAVVFNLASGSAFSQAGWALHYNQQKSGYGSGQDLTATNFSGDVRYMLTHRLALTATAGNERYNYASVSGQPQGNYWAAGFSWAPSTRTSLVANVGRKFFGRTGALSANVRSRRTVWSVSYSESITTTQEQFQLAAPRTISPAGLNKLWEDLYPDAIGRQNAVDFALGPTASDSTEVPIKPATVFTNQVYLLKTWTASAVATGVKNSLVFNLYNTLAKAQTSSTTVLLQIPFNATLFDETRQTGVNGRWGLRVSPRSSVNLSGSYSVTSALTTQRRDTTQLYRLELMRQLQMKLTGSLSLTHMLWHSTANNAYVRENVLTASLNMKF
ncbi:MAG: TIGR03016 family PEP-CTERM system-associated outer membrane protein [Pseudomonadota bacterium]